MTHTVLVTEAPAATVDVVEAPTDVDTALTNVTVQTTTVEEAISLADGIPATVVDSKGDLIVATAADTVARLTAGTNDQILTADSTQPSGLKWNDLKHVELDIRDFAASEALAKAEAGTAMAAALVEAVAAGGATITLPAGTGGNTYTWDTVPAFARNNTATPVPIHVRGKGAKILLTTGGKRLFDFNKVADNDMFRDIEVSNLRIDAGNVGGFHHVIMGNYVAGNSVQRIQWENIYAHDIRVINVGTEDGMVNAHRPGVYLVNIHATSDEATQNTIKHVCFERVHIGDGVTGGGNGGIIVAAAALAGMSANVYLDKLRLINCSHDRGLIPTVGVSLNSFQIGSEGFGGHVEIRGLYSRGSGDLGLEVNAMTTGTIDDVLVDDPFSAGILQTNFRNPEHRERQFIHFNNVHTRRTAAATSTAMGCKGFFVGTDGSSAVPVGTVKFSNFSFYAAQLPRFNDTGYLFRTPNTGDVPTYDHIILENGKVHIENAGTTIDGTHNPAMIATEFNGRLTIDGLDVKVAGTPTFTSGQLSPRLIYLLGGNQKIDFEGVTFDYNVSNTSTLDVMRLGGNTTTLAGAIRRTKVVQVTGTTRRGFRILGSGTLTLSHLTLEECDFTGLLEDIVYDTNDQRAKVRYVRNRWSTHPRPSAAMGTTNFTTATFTTDVGNQYIGGSQAEIHFANSTGAGITKIAVSKDGTTYEEVWNQTSGAMAQNVKALVDNGDYVKVTFATTQPTTRVIFLK